MQSSEIGIGDVVLLHINTNTNTTVISIALPTV